MMADRKQIIDAQLHLLDRQVLDVDGMPVTAVDDVELSGVPRGVIAPGTAPPTISALLAGPVLATRMFGGRPPRSRLERIAWTHVTEVGVVLSLDVKADSLDLTWVESWVREHIIGRIPGGRHDPE